MTQRSVPCTIMRGGTSKGVFFRKEVLPADRRSMTRTILSIFGSGDPMQIDGLGGTYAQTSKAMVVWKSEMEGVHVEYLFGQVGVEKKFIDYTGNCGNLTAAVGPFAIDEGLVTVKGNRAAVRLYNVNTGKRVDALIPVKDGRTEYEGDYVIDGVPHPGARIDVVWHDPGGAVTGSLLPTGNVRDIITAGGERYEATLVDAANPTVFISAEEIGLKGTELPSEVGQECLDRLEKIRSKAAEMMGLVKRATDATSHSPHFPFIAVLGRARKYETAQGTSIGPGKYNLLARLFSMQKMHHAYAVSGAICTACAARIPGSKVNEFFTGDSERIVLGHPKGLIEVKVKKSCRRGVLRIESATVSRTARRLMSGRVFYPRLG